MALQLFRQKKQQKKLIVHMNINFETRSHTNRKEIEHLYKKEKTRPLLLSSLFCVTSYNPQIQPPSTHGAILCQ